MSGHDATGQDVVRHCRDKITIKATRPVFKRNEPVKCSERDSRLPTNVLCCIGDARPGLVWFSRSEVNHAFSMASGSKNCSTHSRQTARGPGDCATPTDRRLAAHCKAADYMYTVLDQSEII